MTQYYQNFHATILSSVVALRQPKMWKYERRKVLFVPIFIEIDVEVWSFDTLNRIVCRYTYLSLITSLLFRNASICTWFRIFDFNSLANFALNAFFWLIIRKVSSWGAVWILLKIKQKKKTIFLIRMKQISGRLSLNWHFFLSDNV